MEQIPSFKWPVAFLEYIEAPESREISEIHLTFDSEFQRELILSMSDHITRKIIRAAQPEIIRSYRITADGEEILYVEGNFQRKRVHRLKKKLRAEGIRIEVLETNGAPDARIFEVRLY